LAAAVDGVVGAIVPSNAIVGDWVNDVGVGVVAGRQSMSAGGLEHINTEMSSRHCDSPTGPAVPTGEHEGTLEAKSPVVVSVAHTAVIVRQGSVGACDGVTVVGGVGLSVRHVLLRVSTSMESSVQLATAAACEPIV